MDVLMTVLRLIHIGGGIFWAGATFFTEGFMGPAVALSGPEGGRFMQRLMTQTRFATVIAITSMATQISGIVMYILDIREYGGLNWLTPYDGIVFTIGGLAGLLTLIPVFTMLRPAGDRIMAIGQQMAASSGPPDPALLAELKTVQERRNLGGRLTALLLIIAVIAMAAARTF